MTRAALAGCCALLLVAAPSGPPSVHGGLPQGPLVACAALTSASDTLGGMVGVLAPGPDGAVAWSDHLPPTSLIVERPGRAPMRIGRPGGGPGEFSMVGAAGWKGDSLWAGDVATGRVHLFSPQGRIARSITAPMRAAWSLVRGDTLVGFASQRLDDATVVLLRSPPGRNRGVDTLARFSGPPLEEMRIPTGPERWSVGFQPFSDRVMPASSLDGRRWCVGIPLSGRPAVRLTCIAPSGATLLDAELDLPGRRITNAIFDAEVDRLGATMPSVPRATIEAAIRRPATMPRVTSALVGNDGQIWLGRTLNRDSASTWIRLDLRGRPLGTLELPRHYRPRLIAGDTVYVVASDDDDVQRAERCRIRA